MNVLTQTEINLFYLTFRVLLDYANRKYHIDEKVDFINAEGLDPSQCKKIADRIWEKPSQIDDLLRVSNVSEEQRNLLNSWKNCIQDTFIVERHLKNGSIFIGSDEKVYQVIGINTAPEYMFIQYPMPVLVKATLLPFGNVIITDGLCFALPVISVPGIKASMKNTYMNAKSNGKIIRQLPEITQETGQQLAEMDAPVQKSKTKAAQTKSRGMSTLYRLKVYPKGYGRSVYRVIEVPENITLKKLCSVILDAFGFDEDHMYEFCMDNRMYGNDSYQSHPEYGERSVNIRLNQLRLVPGQKFSLHYDFGDDWMFVIHVNSLTKPSEKVKTRVIRSEGRISQYR